MPTDRCIVVHRSRRLAAGRSGSARLLVASALVACFGAGSGLWLLLTHNGQQVGQQPILHEVVEGPFQAVVLDQGEVESSNNVEIRCEVRSRNSQGTAILEVVPEGTMVKEGDLLVLLDSSALENERDQQQVVVNASEARVIQAQADLEAAEIAREEYLNGTYKQEEQTILNEIFEAEENLRKAQQYLRYSEKLAAKSYVTALQLEADRFAVKKAENALDLAKRKLEVLRNQTRRKMLVQFDAQIKAAQVAYENEKKSHEVELNKLAEIEDQIAKCTIRVPPGVKGQVVHANRYSRRGGPAEFVVEEGAFVREKQVIIRLPDPTQMQVKATINESRITRVQVGMPAIVQLDALNEVKLKGEVVKVNQYAEPAGFSSGGIKKYGVIVKILDPPPEIRPGMNASVSILVEQLPRAIQVPLQAIYDYRGHTFCLVKKGEQWETREVEVASNNEQMARISSGLKPGEMVVMNPRQYQDLFVLPDLPELPESESDKPEDSTPEAVARAKPDAPLGPLAQLAASPSQLFKQLDVDGDSRLSRQELEHLPGRLRDALAGQTDEDGGIDKVKFLRFMVQQKQQRAKRPGPPAGETQ